MPDRSFRFVARDAVSDHRIFRVHEDTYRLEPEGAERRYVVVDGPDWINVVPITDAREVVLVRQFRHGVREVTLEIPGGMIDPGETPEQAALRELREETGYGGGRLQKLGAVWPNPAYQTNTCHTFAVIGATRLGAPRPDPGERIEVVTRPLASIPELVRSGEIRHALVVLAFGFLGILDPPAGLVPPRAGR